MRRDTYLSISSRRGERNFDLVLFATGTGTGAEGGGPVQNAGRSGAVRSDWQSLSVKV